ncbi:MAG: DMT family transporter [Massilia sp.]|nr:DMT family transporter [Massilia sp.]
MSKPAWACALGAILLWALFATLVRHAGTAPPLLLTGVALCCGSLASVHRWREWRVPAPIFGFGVASLFLYHACLVAAFQLAPIAEANLLNYLWPMLIVVLAACGPAGGGLLPRQLAGCAIAFAGCAVVIAPSSSGLSSAHLGGFALALLAALCWAVYSVAPGYMGAYSSWATGGFCLGAGLLALGAHSLFEAPYDPSAREWAGMAAIGIGPLGLSFVMWDRAMRVGNASTIGSLSYLTPVLSTLALAVTGAVESSAWWRLVPALLLVMGGVRLTR